MKITIASRKSKLALYQTNFVAAKLRELGHECEILELSTKGDEILDRSLAAIGGKNLFIKELETAMHEGRAQIAVHSLKDVGAELAYDFKLAAICKREQENDVLVIRKDVAANNLAELPQGAKVGTTSLRRSLQLRLLRPDLKITNLRGNLQTRLAKLEAAEYDAIVLAYAGLARLELLGGLKICQLSQSQMISACGQGAIAVESINDAAILAILKQLECPQTRQLVALEREFSSTLNGGCGAPIGVNASYFDGKLCLRAIVGRTDASEAICMQLNKAGELANFAGEGERLAQRFIAAGALEMIADCKNNKG